MTDHPDSPSAPRLFWRRLAAFVVDAMLAVMVSTAVLLPVLVLWPGDQVIDDGVFFSKIKFCDLQPGSSADPSPKPEEAVFPAQFVATGGPIKSCIVTRLGVPNGYETTLAYRDVAADGTVSTRLTVRRSVDRAGTPVDGGNSLPGAIDGAIFVLFAILAVRGRWGATVGKRWLGLHVRAASGQTVSTGAALVRELLRSGPVLLAAIIGMASWLLDRGGHDVAAFNSVGNDMLWLVVLVWFLAALISLIWWQGATVWDRVAGAQVVRKIAASPEP